MPTRGKAVKSVLCFFAQDLDTTYLCYSNGRLSREEAPDEILNFITEEAILDLQERLEAAEKSIPSLRDILDRIHGEK